VVVVVKLENPPRGASNSVHPPRGQWAEDSKGHGNGSIPMDISRGRCGRDGNAANKATTWTACSVLWVDLIIEEGDSGLARRLKTEVGGQHGGRWHRWLQQGFVDQRDLVKRKRPKSLRAPVQGWANLLMTGA